MDRKTITSRLIATLGLVAVPLANAQTAPAASPAAPATSASTTTPSSEETLMLTPFEVSTNKDNGYAAGNTLAGGRADTALKITPASISVMTKQFIDDFAITDMNEAAAWTVSMEAPRGGESGPFGGNRFQYNFRGAGGGSNYPSRNNSLYYGVADSYNTERLEFSRGPNATLFGDAGPGGVGGSSSKQGRYNSQFGEAGLRVDTYGGYRTTLDYNYGKERFAVRANLLHQNTKSYIDATSNKMNAISLAASYKLFENTQIRIDAERSAEWNVLYRKTYNEQASRWDRTTINVDNSTIANPANFGLGLISNNTDYYVWNFGTNSFQNYRSNQYQTIGLGYPIPWDGRGDIPNFKPGIDKKFFLGPADAIADRDVNARGIYLDHRFSPNLFAQLAWNAMDVDPVTLYSQGLPGDYRIDVNRLLPDNSPNVNFGKAYSDYSQNSQYQSNGVEEIKLTTSYNFYVPKWFDMKQRFVFNGGWRQDLYEAWTRAWRRVNNTAVPSPQNGANTLRYRVYYDRPRPDMVPVLPPTVAGIQWANVDTGFAADNDRRLTYGQLYSQTTFLNERVGFSLGIRRDKNEDDVTGNLSTFNPNPPYNVNIGNSGVIGAHGMLTSYRTSKNYGTVIYPMPESWRWLSPLGFVANYSENFSIPSTGAPLVSGERPSPPYAKTQDFGLRYSMPNGIAYATVTYYDTDQVGNIGGIANQADIRNIWTNLGYTDPTRTSFEARDLSDRKLDGWEYELTANPTRNLTFTANYARPKVRVVSERPGLKAYYAANLSEWQAGAAGNATGGRTIIDATVIANAIQAIQNTLNGSTAGTLANDAAAKYSMNVAGSYRFTEGVMRGFAVNAGVNYRAKRKIGSRDPNIKFQTASPTIAQNVEAAFDYLYGPSVTSVSAGMNYTKRFGKYSARFQLNVSNLLDDDKPLWTSYGVIAAGTFQNIPNVPAGSLTAAGGNNRLQVLNGFQPTDPRKFTFSTTFSF